MHPNSLQKTVRGLYAILFVLFVIAWSPANAQRNTPGINGDGDILGGSSYNSGGYVASDGWAMAFNLGIESPLGDLKEIYKSAPTFGATLRKRMGNLVYSGSLDYRSYKPKQNSFAITEDDVTYFTATYSKYTGVGAYVGIAYEVPISGLVSIYGGANAGIVFTKFKMTADDGETSYFSQSASNSATYIGPKAGFNISITSNVSLGIEARYSLGTVGANYNSREGGSTTPGFSTFAGNSFLIIGF